MSDLSRLLEDVYGEDGSTEPPEWSSDAALDDAFASWVPGEPLVEVPHVPDAPPVEDALSDDRPELATVVPIRGRWSPSDDDILPRRSGARRLRRR